MRIRRFLAAGFAAATIAAGGVVTAPVAHAGLPAVVDPSIPDGDPNSLRDVLENQVVNGDTVVLEAGATYTLDNCGEGEIDVDAAVTIEGNGATIVQTCESGILVTVDSLDVYDTTLTGGRSSGEGGAIEVDDAVPLSLYGVTLRDNQATGDGGAIDVDGDLLVVDSTLVDNQAGGDGGAVDQSQGESSMRFVRSTIADNCAESDGGAVSTQDDDSVTLVNSTATGNTADQSGALDAVHDNVTLTLVYSDVVGNTLQPEVDCGVFVESAANVDGGTKSAVETSEPDDVRTAAVTGANLALTDDDDDQSTLLAFGSVIAKPVGADNCAVDQGSTVTSSGYNFSDDASCGLDAATDTQNGGDPMLGALAANGGPTATLLPDSASPLVNAIPIDACGGGDTLADGAVTTDQRGITRPQETGCEIGSVELEAPPEPVVIQPTFTG